MTTYRTARSSFHRPDRRRRSTVGVFAGLALATTALLFATGCQRQPHTIGVVLPASGDDAAYGTSTRRGLDLAYEHLRSQARTGHLAPLVYADSSSDAQQARLELQRLAESGAIAVIGGITPAEADALAPVADEIGVVVLSPSASDQRLSDAHRQFFRLAPAASTTGSTIASFAAEELDVESLILVAETQSEGDAYEEGLGPALHSQDGRVVGRFDGTDLGPAIADVRKQRPDAVMLAGHGAWLVDAVDALRGAGYRGTIFAPESFATHAAREASGRTARGVMIASTRFDPDSKDPAVRAFVDAYRATYDEDPDIYAAEAWDALHVLAHTLEDRPNLPGEVRSWLREEIVDWSGASGHIQFDESGAATKYPRVYSVADDLTLRDHVQWLRDEKERLAERREELIQEMLEQQRRLAQTAASG